MKFIKATLLLVVVTLVLAAIFQALATIRDTRRYPPPGEIVMVNGRNMHLFCEGVGEPVIILEAGAMSFSTSWHHLQSELAAVTRTCSYDRADLGWSEPAFGVRDAGDFTADLHALLRNAGESGPYLLIGHSFGGLLQRAYAHMHPEQAVGLVLIDARHPEASAQLPDYRDEINQAKVMFRFASVLSHFGITRLLGDPSGSLTGLPHEVQQVMLAKTSTPTYWQTNLQELQLLDEVDSIVHQRGSHEHLPIRVLAAAEPSEGQSLPFRQAWVNLQEDLRSLSSKAELSYLEGSNHTSILHHPDHAAMVVQGLCQVVLDRYAIES